MQLKMKGRIFLTFDIEAKSGLHIGGSDEGISIGGVDKTVIRDPITNRPYIPGSSLRGKIRSLTEKYTGAEQNTRIGQVRIHSASTQEEYVNSDICQVFGVSGADFATPTRLIVRDVHLSENSAQTLNELRTDLPFTEVKTEVAIDRVTSQASPRQMERVPAGAIFGDAQMIYSLYDGQNGEAAIADSAQDLDRFKTVITGMQLLEDDYLGGLGSRGSGRVALKDIRVTVKSSANYDEALPVHPESGSYPTLDALVQDFEVLKGRIREKLDL
ncbi:MAG: type III-A CRISPR-associated RAMP protein Csm3 [Anaerolineae bacterium]|nr:type III-A CRISPR-associated RAMP protein Csm3 [Anaerolineae bacterium]